MLHCADPNPQPRSDPMFVNTLQKDLTKLAEIAVGTAVVATQSVVVGIIVLIASL